MDISNDVRIRFFSKFRKEKGCWNWTAGKFKAGYGAFRFGERNGVITSHRLSYLIHKGEIPIRY